MTLTQGGEVDNHEQDAVQCHYECSPRLIHQHGNIARSEVQLRKQQGRVPTLGHIHSAGRRTPLYVRQVRCIRDERSPQAMKSCTITPIRS